MGKLAKIRKLTLGELRVRASQAFQEFAESRGWSVLTRLPTDQELLRLIDFKQVGRELGCAEDLLEHFRTRSTPTFFSSFQEPTGTVEAFRSTWPDQAEA